MSIHEAVQNDENVLQNTILLQTKASMTGQFLFSLNLFANSLDWYKLMTWHGTPRNIYTMLFVNQILYRFILIKNLTIKWKSFHYEWNWNDDDQMTIEKKWINTFNQETVRLSKYTWNLPI